MELRKDQILLVDGPATVKVVEGVSSIYNCVLTPRKPHILRPWKRYPVRAETDCLIELNLGEEGSYTVVDGDESVERWGEYVEGLGAHGRVGVLGGVDSGKTAFTTFAANTLVRKYRLCVVVSFDPGQSYFTPPSVVGAAESDRPVYELSSLKPFWVKPVGTTSAASAATLVVEAAEELSSKLQGDPCVVVDMDGWVEGPHAAAHKAAVLKNIGCGEAVILGNIPENVKQAVAEAGIKVVELLSSQHIKPRSTADRKKIREWSYRRFLGNVSLRTLPLSWLELRVADESSSALDMLKAVQESAASKLAQNDDEGGLENLLCKHRIGLLAYIYNTSNMYSGLGIVCGVNSKRGLIKVLTSVEEGVKKIIFSRIVLTAEGDEYSVLD